MSEYQRNPNTKCRVCKTAIYRRPAEIERNGGNVFCSQVCYGKHGRKEVPCSVCSAPILAGANKKTYSRACANIHRTGISYKMNRPRDKVKSQRSLKVRLLEQRGKVCERCGYNKQEILEVHHIDRNRENNELGNLALICPNCHAEEHLLKNSWLKNK